MEDIVVNFLQQQIASGDLQIAPLPNGATLKLRTLLRMDIQDSAYVAASNTSGFTCTPAQINSANTLNVLNLTGTLAAGAALTLPLVAGVATTTMQGYNNSSGTFSYDPLSGVSDTFILDVYNTSAGAYSWTITTNTGWTLNGTMTVAQNYFRRLLCQWTSATTISAQSVGTFAIGGI